MRDTVIGMVLAVLFLGALFAANHFLPRSSEANSIEASNEIQRGFTGQTTIGSWQLVCPPGQPTGPKAAIPFSLNPNPRTAAGVSSVSQGRCRATLIERRTSNPKAVVLVMSFRLAGPNLAIIVLTPPLAKKGDILVLGLGRAGLKLPVNACNAGECLARGLLSAQAQALLLAGSKAILVFPSVQNGKPLGMIVPLGGLKQAVEAMQRAES